MSLFKKLFAALTRRERIVFGVASVACVASLAVVIGIVIAQSTRSVPTAGGDYTEGMVGQPEYVNPVSAKTEADLSLVKMIYQNVGEAAQSIESSPDGKTWTVRLKENLLWQDGTELTSDDVIFTVEAIQDPDANSPLAPAWQDVSVSRASELEVQFTLPNPNAFFGKDLAGLYIIPKHIFADVPPGNWRFSDYMLKPIGSGPYEFSSYDQESSGFVSDYHLTAWSGYSGARPLINNFDFAFFPNESNLVKAFNDASINGFAPMTGDLQAINRPYDLFSWRSPAYYAVFWNQSKNPAFTDPAVRTALSAAIDRTALVNDALQGNGIPDDGPVPPGAPYAAAVNATNSIDFASSTLTAAGWLPGAGGIRVKTTSKSSTTLAFSITVPDIDFLVKTADDLQAAWQAVGAQVSIATDTPENMASEEVPNRDYEALLFGEVLGPNSDLRSFWDSSERFSPGLNLSLYSDPSADALIESILGTMDDASRTQKFASLEQTIVDDEPAAFLYSPNDMYVTDKSVQGISTDFLADPSDRFLEVPSWYLDTARVLK